MYGFITGYIRHAARIVLLFLALAAGYYARPHWPPPAKVTSGFVIAVGETPYIVVLVNDHGEAVDYTYKACLADDACRDTVKRLVHTDKIQILVLAPASHVS